MKSWILFGGLVVGLGVLPEGSYLVKLKKNHPDHLNLHIVRLFHLFKGHHPSNRVHRVHKNLGNLYTAKLTYDVKSLINLMDEVEYIEEDSIVTANLVEQNATWGLERISQRDKVAGISYNYTYQYIGAGTTVYVIDSGIMIEHPEFEGRARFGARFVGDNDKDENGHGTHCAGIIGSKTYGVAKKASLVAVRVLNAAGAGTTSSMIAGIDWAIGNYTSKETGVISMSLGTKLSKATNDAVEEAFKKGFVVAVAAGNDNVDACTKSPGSAPSAITVGAIDINDTRASFSNYGKCVDLFAPGVQILSTWNDGKSKLLSGTSMATPFVAGLAANFLHEAKYTPQQVTERLTNLTTHDKLLNLGQDSPNLLAFGNLQTYN